MTLAIKPVHNLPPYLSCVSTLGLHDITHVMVDSAFYPLWDGKMSISFRAE